MTDEDRIARVARALCAADGYDPEGDHMIVEFDEAHTRMREVTVPRWTTYTAEARRMVAAMVAVGVIA